MKEIVLLLGLFFTLTCYAQKELGPNLIPNPSFEKFKGKGGGDIKNAMPWIGIGTVDFYTKPEKRDTTRYKGARTGKAYAGLRFQADYKEYMYVPLTKKLDKGIVYSFSMYVRLLDYNNVTATVKQLGVYFSEEAFRVGMVFDQQNIVDSSYKKGLAGTKDWIHIKGNYLAKGNEKFIILGNFRTKMKDDFVKKKKMKLFEFLEAYYYIDDVSLFRTDIIADTLSNRLLSEPPQELPENLALNQVVEIKDVYFDENTATIKAAAFKNIDQLIKMLNNNPLVGIQLNIYEADANLGKKRIKAIHDYLIEKDIINPITQKVLPPSPNTTGKSTKVEVIVTST